MGERQPASAKSLLWLITLAGCTLGLSAAVILSVCSVARRLAMLLLSSAPTAASLEADPWTVMLADSPAWRSLLCRALRVLR